MQDAAWNQFDAPPKIFVIFGHNRTPKWKKLSKNADNKETRYVIEPADLNLSIDSKDDFGKEDNLKDTEEDKKDNER